MKTNKQGKISLAQTMQLQDASWESMENKLKIENIKKEQEKINLEIDNVEGLLDNLLKNVSSDDGCKENVDVVDTISEEEMLAIREVYLNKRRIIDDIPYSTYESYVNDCNTMIENREFDFNVDPLYYVLTTDRKSELLSEYKDKFEKLPWSKLDYIIVSLTSVVAILVDLLLVSIPKDMKFLGKEYSGSPITKKIKEITIGWQNGTSTSKLGIWMHKAIKYLENYAKVPYDVATNNINKGIDVDGLSPNYHRFMEMGHDPILGFIIGVIDCIRGTCTVIDKKGILHIIENGNKIDGYFKVFKSFLKVFAHLFSDVCSSSGIAPPFFSLLELCTGKSPFILNKNGDRVSFNNVARFMYKNGYDMRHMLTMSIESLIIELSIRTYCSFCYIDTLDNKKSLKYKCKKNDMLLAAHSVSMGGDILKMWLYGWNPVAFNYSEFIVLLVTIFKAIKSNAKFQKMIETEFYCEWNKILNDSIN